jgi:caa(3)-type oxidase subunit IV
MEPNIHKHHHHILPTKAALLIGTTLLILTGVTVGIAHVDLGPLNFLVAMAVASVKALLVALFFMNLWYDRRENAVIFVTSFLFLTIFIVLTATDLFFRGDVYVKGPIFAATSSVSKVKKPWISTPELVSHGKELFQVQCVSCHGVDGKGDGPAASALNPKPRNFHVAEGWKNGRKPTMVFKTLKEGLPPSAMASYDTLPPDDRWALSHYVLSLGGTPAEADTAADFTKIGVDPTQETGGATVAPTIPLTLAMERSRVPETEAESTAHVFHAGDHEATIPSPTRGGQLYRDACVQCHGVRGEGGIKVATLAGYPAAYVITRPLTPQLDSLKSQEAFNKVVIWGIPGEIMPGYGQLSSSDLTELYQYVRSLSSTTPHR